MRQVSRLNLLLMPNEKDVPELVLRTYRFLSSLGIWFQISRNVAAYSCDDAAKKRLREGRIGIPIYDEMKSLFCGCRDRNSQFIYVFIHCRADRRVNFRSVQRLIEARSRPQMLSRESLRKLLGFEYGGINPFDVGTEYILDGPLIAATVWHVFDNDVFAGIATPGTMMTNAGSLTWAVEFRPRELIVAMQRTHRKVIRGDFGVADRPRKAR